MADMQLLIYSCDVHSGQKEKENVNWNIYWFIIIQSIDIQVFLSVSI